MEHDAENTQDLDGRLHLLINQGTYLAGEFRGTAYRPIQTYKDPIHNSKMVLVSWLGSRVRQTDWFVVEKDR